jgi:hypothetical protein
MQLKHLAHHVAGFFGCRSALSSFAVALGVIPDPSPNLAVKSACSGFVALLVRSIVTIDNVGRSMNAFFQNSLRRYVGGTSFQRSDRLG